MKKATPVGGCSAWNSLWREEDFNATLQISSPIEHPHHEIAKFLSFGHLAAISPSDSLVA